MSRTPRPYKPPVVQTKEQQINDWVADLLADAQHSEAQAENGPFYPERDITPDSLRAYAASCRAQAADPESTLREALRGSGQPL